MTKDFLGAALKVDGLSSDLMLGLIGICITADSTGLNRRPEAWADIYSEGRFPKTGLFDLRNAGMLDIGFGDCWYAILQVRSGRLFAGEPAGRPGIPVQVSRAVRLRDGNRCTYCGATEGKFHLDHIKPWSRGGQHSIENLTVACPKCNFAKRDRTPEEMGWTL